VTDRHSGYLVILSSDIREDDAEYILNAIRMIKGVADITPITSEPYEGIVWQRVNAEWRTKLRQVMEEM
jgi:hypothetical protein